MYYQDKKSGCKLSNQMSLKIMHRCKIRWKQNTDSSRWKEEANIKNKDAYPDSIQPQVLEHRFQYDVLG